MVELYEDMHGEIVVTLLRIMLGILLLISQKIIPERFKEFIVTSYYGVLVCMITTYVSNLKISSMIIGIVLGLVVSVMLTIYNKTEDFTNLIVIFIAMYEIMEYPLSRCLRFLYRLLSRSLFHTGYSSSEHS